MKFVQYDRLAEKKRVLRHHLFTVEIMTPVTKSS